jgi:nitrous oxidase accessory protein
MRGSTALVLILVLATSSMVSVLPVKGEPKTIVVPDDYSTVKEAVNAAKEGETIFVKKGIYEGTLNQTLVITKKLSLIGEDANTTILKLHPPLVPMRLFTLEYMGYLEAIKIEANSFKLANLTVTGDGGSISVTGDATELIGNIIEIEISITGNATQLAGNIISRALSSTGNGTRITRNTLNSINLNGYNQTIMQNAITGTADFLISCVGSNNNIALNNVTGNSKGIYSKGSHNTIQENYLNTTSETSGSLEIEGDKNTIANNSPASFIRVGGASNFVFGNTIRGNLAVVGNGNIFFSNYLQGLVLGNRIQDASNNTFYHNNFDFVENEALPEGEKTFTVWAGVKGDNFLDNGLEGNFWSDYSGVDWNLDGIGDMSYVIDAQDTRNYHYMANFDVADVVLIDHHPLMAAFDTSNVSTEETFRIPWTFVIISIIVISAALILYFKRRKH